MIDFLKEIDASILLFINGLNASFLDEIMWILTNKFTWFPLYLFLFILVYLNSTKKVFLLFVIIGFATVGLADFTASQGLKKNVQRYRPSHHLELKEQLNFYQKKDGEVYRGGQYGFVSGHAANSFAIAIFFSLFLKRRFKHIFYYLIPWAVLVCYTRLYLGVHYPSDIIGGALLGTVLAVLGFGVFRRVS